MRIDIGGGRGCRSWGGVGRERGGWFGQWVRVVVRHSYNKIPLQRGIRAKGDFNDYTTEVILYHDGKRVKEQVNP